MLIDLDRKFSLGIIEDDSFVEETGRNKLDMTDITPRAAKKLPDNKFSFGKLGKVKFDSRHV